VIDGVIRQIIEESEGGVFVPPGEDRKLAESILFLSSNPDQIREYGENARNYLINNLDRQVMLEKTRKLFQQLRNT